jgi:hypothetical protein
MVLTIIIIIVMLVIAGGLVALYREVGLGSLDPGVAARPTVTPLSTSGWPLGTLRVGSHFAVPSAEPFTGFLALCADDQDPLAELHSAAVVAEDWDYPLLVAIAKTTQPNGWTDRLDSLPGNIGHYVIRDDELRALKPARLPVVTFLNENRVLDASTGLESPSAVSTRFQNCRFGLTR